MMIGLNTDGCSRHNGTISTGRGLLQDAYGNVIFCFSNFYGPCTILEAETRALMDGIKWCLQRDFYHIEAEIDFLILFKKIQELAKSPWIVDSMVQKIKYCKNLCQFKLSHIFRESNAVADFFKNEAFIQRRSRIYSNLDIPQAAKGLIRLYQMGCHYFRVCNA
ncbi:hypothetical protein ACH5RR_032369 [Cinchona calisaya]|uniref:RNase H type-1 domain-containing protein n=1 Tax=Cinchona calisaya TaxID=153742 RepID=A0ABD2YMA3_9GENT